MVKLAYSHLTSVKTNIHEGVSYIRYIVYIYVRYIYIYIYEGIISMNVRFSQAVFACFTVHQPLGSNLQDDEY